MSIISAAEGSIVGRNFWLGVAAYLAPTFPLGYFCGQVDSADVTLSYLQSCAVENTGPKLERYAIHGDRAVQQESIRWRYIKAAYTHCDSANSAMKTLRTFGDSCRA